jgi:amidase
MPPSQAQDLVFTPATELAALIRSRQLSAEELMRATLGQIGRVNPQVNAVVTLLPEADLLATARRADEAVAAARRSGTEASLGVLHGLPTVHKDLALTKGVRTTFGSPVFADFVPGEDSLIVSRQREAGALMLGKSNTPEFGAGSQTFNAVFGKTRNPYDLSKTCGGSSGGAAVALATGMAAVADGSDLGGSLRNPAGYCNVVGLRPSPGRVPTWPSRLPWNTLGVEGPMGRTVADVALLLQALAGPHPGSPVSVAEPPPAYPQLLQAELKGKRIAWAPDLLGLSPVDAQVAAVLREQAKTFEVLGCVLEEALPDLSGADEVFQVMRAQMFAALHGPLLTTHREQLKDTVVWNIEAGLKLTADQIIDAQVKHGQVFERVREFFTRFDYIALPTAQVPPFSVDIPYPSEINGQPMANYLTWMQTCYWITVTGSPAISVPAGFTPSGLPVGLQLVAPYQQELKLLQVAHAFEQATRFGQRRPVV